MRKAIYSLALTGLLSLGMAGSAALAQDNPAPAQQEGGGGGHHRMNPDAQLKHMTKELDLTPEQQTQIKPILESRDQQAQQLMQDQSLSRPDRHSKMTAIQTDSKAKIEAVLNDSQKQKFEAMQARMQEHAHDRTQGGQQEPQSQQ
jgi:periplasmic protein CpxP/Spy